MRRAAEPLRQTAKLRDRPRKGLFRVASSPFCNSPKVSPPPPEMSPTPTPVERRSRRSRRSRSDPRRSPKNLIHGPLLTSSARHGTSCCASCCTSPWLPPRPGADCIDEQSLATPQGNKRVWQECPKLVLLNSGRAPPPTGARFFPWRRNFRARTKSREWEDREKR